MVRRVRTLTPLLVLACAGSGAWASKKAFNIQDDLLAYPQVCHTCFGFLASAEIKRAIVLMVSACSSKSSSLMIIFSIRGRGSYYRNNKRALRLTLTRHPPKAMMRKYIWEVEKVNPKTTIKRR
jgi:hypothetical protein